MALVFFLFLFLGITENYTSKLNDFDFFKWMMFEELLNINIKTCPEAELMVWLQQTDAVAAFRIQATQELLRRFGNRNCNIPAPEKNAGSIKIALANGRRLSEEEFQNINEEDFDIILDLTANRLRYRKNPIAHTPLKDADLKGIRSRRIDILKRLLENPSRYVSAENTYKALGHFDKIEVNTLSKAISLLRKALE